MADDLSELKKPVFSTALNDLDNILMQGNKAFLLGAGCSKCAGLPLTDELTRMALASPLLDTATKNILSSIKDLFKGAVSANIEDYLSELVDLMAIAERRSVRGATTHTASLSSVAYSANELKTAADQIKQAIASIIDQDVKMEVHLKFIKAVHRPSRPGRTVIARPVDYLILNYDTLIESSLALEKISYADGMNGGTSAWWDPSTFDSKDVSARVLKLHGSIDWSEIAGDVLPRRIGKKLKLPIGSDQKVLIWPASTKYRETQRDPYAQLASLGRRILRPQHGTQTVLVVCGYSFSDSHINIELERALRESAGELTMIVFTFDDSPVGELKKWYLDKEISDQIRIYAKNGFFHGTTQVPSTTDLPWCKFENVTRLLGGER